MVSATGKPEPKPKPKPKAGGFKFDGFMKGMVAAVVLAFLWPAPGAAGGALHAELLNKLGVAVVFFLNGLSLSLPAMRAGAAQWRAHLLIQLSTFVLFPLIGVVGIWATRGHVPADLQMGFFYLCALPSTVSSSVALTAAARGNVPVAVFNATLSSLIGVVVTPLWMGWVLGRTGVEFPIGPVVMDLVIWVLLPLVAGQLARPALGGWAAAHKARLQWVDRGTILMLIYTSFADSVVQGVWSRYGVLTVVWTGLSALVLFAIVMVTVRALSGAIGLSPPERIAAIFCGSKKTLAAGVPMAHMIFGTNPALGLILMPLMLYHPLQLALCGVLAQRWVDSPPGAKSAEVPTP